MTEWERILENAFIDIAKAYDLKSGDMPPEDEMMLRDIIKAYIKNNQERI